MEMAVEKAGRRGSQAGGQSAKGIEIIGCAWLTRFAEISGKNMRSRENMVRGNRGGRNTGGDSFVSLCNKPPNFSRHSEKYHALESPASIGIALEVACSLLYTEESLPFSMQRDWPALPIVM